MKIIMAHRSSSAGLIVKNYGTFWECENPTDTIFISGQFRSFSITAFLPVSNFQRHSKYNDRTFTMHVGQSGKCILDIGGSPGNKISKSFPSYIEALKELSEGTV